MFTGEEDHEIPFEEGAEYTAQFRKNNPDKKKGGYFSKSAITKLLSQDECVGLRIYFAEYENGSLGMVMVGVKSNENDQIGNDYVCMDKCIPCPDRCGINDILNSDS
jgi:hypothetical protein